MGKVIIFFACMTWLFTTISAAGKRERDPMDLLVYEQLGFYPEQAILEGDKMTVQKQINGNLVPRDIVEGLVMPLNTGPGRGFPALTNSQLGRAHILIDRTYQYIVRMAASRGYKENGGLSNIQGETTYAVNITRSNHRVYETIVKRRSEQHNVRPGYPIVVFVDHHNGFFNGEIERAVESIQLAVDLPNAIQAHLQRRGQI
ncbi:uncharacterized protein LOC117171738 isoform X2 [Belonocnema kinseyi]|uniref:uncharacterized protein LOC117171738 isoform X2 n=1 Tax=Belonocnema kinseyi TaxID=2817044 RepID=UPI00143D5B33|nr:uncharacterized protein LOC117171738 isoform X2 [Belonocnema kinseyi]